METYQHVFINYQLIPRTNIQISYEVRIWKQ